jgi:hypothetical protein
MEGKKERGKAEAGRGVAQSLGSAAGYLSLADATCQVPCHASPEAPSQVGFACRMCMQLDSCAKPKM